jgi:multicomponent Na+:H+ antiporter subunit E
VSSIAYGAVLAAIWVLLWGAWSAANVLSGAAIAAVLILLLVPRSRRGGGLPIVRPMATVRLGAYLLRELVVSNLVLIREIVSPRSRIRTGVVAVPLTGCSDQLLTVLANFTALTPGTMPIEVARDPAVMYVHVLHLRDVDAVRRDLWHLRDLTVRAFGSAEAVASLERR